MEGLRSSPTSSFWKGPLPLSGPRKHTCFLAEQRFFAIFENASVASNQGLARVPGPGLPRPLLPRLFLNDQEVRWGQTEQEEIQVKCQEPLPVCFPRKLKKVFLYSSETHDHRRKVQRATERKTQDMRKRILNQKSSSTHTNFAEPKGQLGKCFRPTKHHRDHRPPHPI